MESQSENEEIKCNEPLSLGPRRKQSANSLRFNTPREDKFEPSIADYINASHINTCLDRKLIVAAMAPNKRTIGSFWQMIFEQNVRLIIMLCNFKVNQLNQSDYYFGKPKKHKGSAMPKGRLGGL